MGNTESSVTKVVGIYVRVSTNEQSTEIQLTDLTQYAESRGWTVHKIYDETATGTNANRSQLKSMLLDAQQRRFDVVLAWKLDRIFRSLKDCVVNLQDLADLGIGFVSYKDPGVDMTTSSGRLMLHLLGAFAEFEASLIKERVKAGIANARKKGKRFGRPPTINYEKVRILRSQGQSLRQISKALGTTKSAVSKILHKPCFQMPKNTGIQNPIIEVAHTTLSETANIKGNSNEL